MGGASIRTDADAKDATGGGPETVVRGFAIDQKPALRGDSVRGHGAITAPLLSGDKHQADAALAVGAQLLRRGNLRGENAFGVTGAASIECVAFDTAGKKRRHAIEVSREGDVRFTGGGNDVDAAFRERLLEHRVSTVAQVRGEHAGDFALTARG